ncbi:MAG: MFS transporter [Promethearchaeota archaeon]
MGPETSTGGKKLIFAAACIGWIHDAFNLTLITFLTADIIAAFNVTTAEMGWLISGQFIATFFGAILFGSLADRKGRKPSLIYSVLWDAIITSLSAFSPNFAFLFLTRICSGMGVSWGVGYTLVAETFGKKPKRRGLAGGLLHSTFLIGFILADIVAIFILPLNLPFGSWRYCFLFSLFPIPIIIIFQFKMKESEIMVEYIEKVKKEGKKIRKVPILNIFKNKRDAYLLIIFMIVVWLGQVVYHNLVDFAPYYFELLGYEDLARQMIIVVGILAALIIISFGALADVIGRRIAFFISSLIVFISSIIFYISIPTGNINSLVFAYVIFGLGQGYMGVQGVWLTETFATGERASAASTVYSFARGFALSGIIVGTYANFLVLYYGMNSALALGTAMGTALFFAIPMLILPWFIPETKGVELKAYNEE